MNGWTMQIAGHVVARDEMREEKDFPAFQTYTLHICHFASDREVCVDDHGLDSLVYQTRWDIWLISASLE
jgi:hypothetical protein